MQEKVFRVKVEDPFQGKVVEIIKDDESVIEVSTPSTENEWGVVKGDERPSHACDPSHPSRPPPSARPGSEHTIFSELPRQSHQELPPPF